MGCVFNCSYDACFILLPLFLRFAYETGAKCLYPNLPGEHALVVNHREAGENYASHGGPDGDLIPHSLLQELGLVSETREKSTHQEVPLWSSPVFTESAYQLPVRPTENEVLKWSLLQLPGWITLVKYQYDFNLRRAGALGADRTHHSGFSTRSVSEVTAEEETSHSCAACGDFLTVQSGVESRASNKDNADQQEETESPELEIAWAEVHHAMQLQSIHHTNHAITSSSAYPVSPPTNTTTNPVYAQLSAEHWVNMVDMMEGTILPGAAILHLSLTPLVVLLSNQRNMYTSTLLAGPGPGVDYPALNGARLVQELIGLVNTQYTLLVLDAVQLLSASYTGHNLIDVYHNLHPAEYLLVVGGCSSAPTDLSVQYKSNNANLTEYVMVEDMCSIVGEDLGAVLYRCVFFLEVCLFYSCIF